MYKRILSCFLMSVLLVTSLFSENKIVASARETIAVAELSFGNMSEFEINEFQNAYLEGIVTAELFGDLSRDITGKEFRNLLLNLEYQMGCSPSETMLQWVSGGTDNTLTRKDAINDFIWQFHVPEIGKTYDDYNNATETGRGNLYAIFNEMLEEDYSSLVWPLLNCDLTTGIQMLKRDMNGYLRIHDNLTVEEAIQMAYRYFNSNEPKDNWVALDSEEARSILTLTERQLTMVNAMPEPTYENLPDYNGMWYRPNLENSRYVYESDFKTISEMGFNFMRYNVPRIQLMDENGKVNELTLQTIDRAISYAIKYGIHLRLELTEDEDNRRILQYLRDGREDGSVSIDGFGTSGFTAEEYMNYLKTIWNTLAIRYQNVPNNVLTFQLFGEPGAHEVYGTDASLDMITETQYVTYTYALADAIWESDADRLLATDGAFYGNFPSTMLAEEGVKRNTDTQENGEQRILQTFHLLCPGYMWQSGFYGQAPTINEYPSAFIPPSMHGNADNRMTIIGNSEGYPNGTVIQVKDKNAKGQYLQLSASKEGAETNFEKIVSNDGTIITFTLTEDADTLELFNNKDEGEDNSAWVWQDSNLLDYIWITYNIASTEPLPIYSFFKEDGSNYTVADYEAVKSTTPVEQIGNTLVQRFVNQKTTYILCGGDDYSLFNEEGQHSWHANVTIQIAEGNNNQNYTANFTKTWESDLNADGSKPVYSFTIDDLIDAYCDKWQSFAQTYQTEPMQNEMGGANGMDLQTTYRYFEAMLSEFAERGWPWGGIETGGFNGGLFDDYQYQGKYIEYDAHYTESSLLALYQQYMTKFEIVDIVPVAYDGTEKQPTVTVRYRGKTLTEGTDYTVTYEDNIDPGMASIVVNGLGQYQDMITASNFMISVFEGEENSYYNNNKITFSLEENSYAIPVAMNAEVILPDCVETKSGYSFIGWSESKDSISAEYPSGSLYTKVTEGEIILYPVWKKEECLAAVVYSDEACTIVSEDLGTYADVSSLNEAIGEREGYLVLTILKDVTIDALPAGANLNQIVIMSEDAKQHKITYTGTNGVLLCDIILENDVNIEPDKISINGNGNALILKNMSMSGGTITTDNLDMVCAETVTLNTAILGIERFYINQNIALTEDGNNVTWENKYVTSNVFVNSKLTVSDAFFYGDRLFIAKSGEFVTDKIAGIYGDIYLQKTENKLADLTVKSTMADMIWQIRLHPYDELAEDCWQTEYALIEEETQIATLSSTADVSCTQKLGIIMHKDEAGNDSWDDYANKEVKYGKLYFGIAPENAAPEVTSEISYVYKEGNDRIIELDLRDKQVKEIKNGEMVLAEETEYSYDSAGNVILHAEYLDTLPACENPYLIAVSYKQEANVGENEGSDEISDTIVKLYVEKADAEIAVSTNYYEKTYGDSDFAIEAVSNGECGIAYTLTDGKSLEGERKAEHEILTVTDDGIATICGTGRVIVQVSTKENPNYNMADTIQIRIQINRYNGFRVETIEDMTYTGKVICPQPRVYDGNSEVLLVKGRDYTLTYANNVNASVGVTDSTKLPTVIIKGKGSYSKKMQVHFNILPKDIKAEEVSVDDFFLEKNNEVQKKVPVITYNKKKLKGVLKVENGVTKTQNKDFIYSYTSSAEESVAYKEPGCYPILVEGIGNYSGNQIVYVNIEDKGYLLNKASIKKIPTQNFADYAGRVELDASNLVVTTKIAGNKITLKEGEDFRTEYDANDKAGTATVTIIGIGDFTGSKKATFKIKGVSIAKAEVKGIKERTYNGKEWEQDITVVLKRKQEGIVEEIPLNPKTDYAVTYRNNKNAGEASVIITGTGAYTGTIKKSFDIIPYNLTGETNTEGVTKEESLLNEKNGLLSKADSELHVKYLKGGVKPNVELYFDGELMKVGKDYTITYANNKAVTTEKTKKQPTITIKGKGNFKGKINKIFTIDPKDLDDAEAPVTMRVNDKVASKKAGGYVVKPVLTDTDGKILEQGKDYTKPVYTTTDANGEIIVLNGKSVVDAGQVVTVSVQGMGNYTHKELIKTYRITEQNFANIKVATIKKTYNGRPVTLTKDDFYDEEGNSKITIGKGTNKVYLEYGVDFEIVPGTESYKKNDKKGTASVSLQGVGKYGGIKTIKFEIAAKNLER